MESQGSNEIPALGCRGPGKEGDVRERIEHMSKPMSHIFRHHSNSDEFLPSFHVFSLPRVHLANHSYEELGMRENFRERQRLVCFYLHNQMLS